MSLPPNGAKKPHRARARASATASGYWSWDTTDEAGSPARLSRCTSGSDETEPQLGNVAHCCKTDVLVYAYTYDDFDATKSCEPTPAQCAASVSPTSTATASSGTRSSLTLP